MTTASTATYGGTTFDYMAKWWWSSQIGCQMSQHLDCALVVALHNRGLHLQQSGTTKLYRSHVQFSPRSTVDATD